MIFLSSKVFSLKYSETESELVKIQNINDNGDDNDQEKKQQIYTKNKHNKHD